MELLLTFDGLFFILTRSVIGLLFLQSSYSEQSSQMDEVIQLSDDDKMDTSIVLSENDTAATNEASGSITASGKKSSKLDTSSARSVSGSNLKLQTKIESVKKREEEKVNFPGQLTLVDLFNCITAANASIAFSETNASRNARNVKRRRKKSND